MKQFKRTNSFISLIALGKKDCHLSVMSFSVRHWNSEVRLRYFTSKIKNTRISLIALRMKDYLCLSNETNYLCLSNADLSQLGGKATWQGIYAANITVSCIYFLQFNNSKINEISILLKFTK